MVVALTRLPRIAVVLIALAALGCGGDDQPSGEPVKLLDHDKWVELESGDDPFWATRPNNMTPKCAPFSFQIEGFAKETQSIEIDTTACDYLTIGQPLPVAVRQGDSIKLVTWHLRLSADGATTQNPVEGLVGIALGKTVLWQKTLSIPGPEDSFVMTVTAKANASAGENVAFHVRNHGTNTYNLMKLELQPKQPK